jgi:hypothetical protein
VGGQENSSFANFGLWVGLWGLQMCCFVGGVSLSLCGGRKNKIISPQTAPPYQRSSNLISLFFVIISIFIYRVNLSSWWLSTLAYNGEYKNSSRLRGTFLSSYKKVEAGYNP